MAIKKTLLFAIKALSKPDINVKKTYKLQRGLNNLLHPLRLECCKIPRTIDCNGLRVPVYIFSTQPDASQPVLLFFHGGGWSTGGGASYDGVCSTMARLTGHTVVSVDYRLAPEHKFPCALEDCYCAARELFLNPSVLNTAPDKITLIGDSAGGNLAAAVSLLARDKGEFLPSRQILLYPATYNDHTVNSPFASVIENGEDYLLTSKRICDFVDMYIGSVQDYMSEYFAPLLAKRFTDQPKTLVITAQYDPLRDEGEEYARRLARAGNKVELTRIENALHGFISLPAGLTQVKNAYDTINRFLYEVNNNENTAKPMEQA